MNKAAGILAAMVLACSGIAPALGASPDGEWTGQIHCSPVRGDPVRYPAFSNPISMVVSGKSVSVTRDTSVVHEALIGKLAANGYASLAGEGRFKSGNRQPWTTKIEGQFSGSNFNGRGDVFISDGTRVRDCTVELAQVVIAQPRVAQRSDPKPVAVAATSASRDVKQPDRTGSNVTPVQPPVSSQAVATPNSAPPSSTAVRGVIKPEQAYECVVDGGKSNVVRFLAADGSYFDQWSDRNGYYYEVGRWLVKSASEGNLLALSGFRRYLVKKQIWEWPEGKAETQELISSGSSEGKYDFESRVPNTKKIYMTCSLSKKITMEVREKNREMTERAKRADVYRPEQLDNKGLPQSEIAQRHLVKLTGRIGQNKALGPKCMSYIEQVENSRKAATDAIAEGINLTKKGQPGLAENYFRSASDNLQYALSRENIAGCP